MHKNFVIGVDVAKENTKDICCISCGLKSDKKIIITYIMLFDLIELNKQGGYCYDNL